MYKFAVVLSLFLMSFHASSAIVVTKASKISSINSYSSFPNGDTLIQVDSPHAECPGGLWLKIDDIGFSKNMSIVLSAFHSQSNIIFYADTTRVWGHSPAAYCYATQIKLVR